jgi:hypothetical protein
MKRIDNATCDVCAREHVDVVQVDSARSAVTSPPLVPTQVCGACLTGAALVLARDGRSLPPGWNADEVREALGPAIGERVLDLFAALHAEHGDALRVVMHEVVREKSPWVSGPANRKRGYTLTWGVAESANDGASR